MISFLKRKFFFVIALVCTVPSLAGAAWGQAVIATIPIPGGYAGQGAIDPVAQRVYMPTDSPAVSVIDEKTNKIVGTIYLATQFGAVTAALNPFTGLLYIGAQNGGLFIVNPKTYATVGFVNVNAVSVAVNPATNTIYASDFNSTLYVVDGKTNNIEATVLLDGIQNIAVNPFTDRVYAALGLFPGAVGVVNGKTNKEIAQIPAGSPLSFSVAVDPVRNVFYSAEQFGTVTVYDGKTNTKITSISIPGQPAGLSFDPLTREAYVSDYANGLLDIINGSTNEITGSLAVGDQPEYQTDDPFHKLLYVGVASTDPDGASSPALAVVKTN